MKQIKLVLSMLVVAVTSSAGELEAGTTPLLSRDLGFLSENSTLVPTEIKKAAESTFMLVLIPDKNDSPLLRFEDLSGDIEAIKLRLISKTEDPFEKVIIEKQIENCLKTIDVESESCLIIGSESKSTGFLAETGDTLWTNAHVVVKKKNSPQALSAGRSIKFFIFDRTGKLVFNPYEEKATIEESERNSTIGQINGLSYAADSDYIKIKLSRTIGSPIPIAKDEPQLNQNVFLIGYPACTGCTPEDQMFLDAETIQGYTNRGEGKNSVGNSLQFSSGKIISSTFATDFFGLSTAMASAFNLDQMLFYTADSNLGSSGGPIVNDRGEVIGIHSGGQSKLISGHHLRLSRGVLFPEPVHRNGK